MRLVICEWLPSPDKNPVCAHMRGPALPLAACAKLAVDRDSSIIRLPRLYAALLMSRACSCDSSSVQAEISVTCIEDILQDLQSSVASGQLGDYDCETDILMLCSLTFAVIRVFDLAGPCNNRTLSTKPSESQSRNHSSFPLLYHSVAQAVSSRGKNPCKTLNLLRPLPTGRPAVNLCMSKGALCAHID